VIADGTQAGIRTKSDEQAPHLRSTRDRRLRRRRSGSRGRPVWCLCGHPALGVPADERQTRPCLVGPEQRDMGAARDSDRAELVRFGSPSAKRRRQCPPLNQPAHPRIEFTICGAEIPSGNPHESAWAQYQRIWVDRRNIRKAAQSGLHHDKETDMRLALLPEHLLRALAPLPCPVDLERPESAQIRTSWSSNPWEHSSSLSRPSFWRTACAYQYLRNSNTRIRAISPSRPPDHRATYYYRDRMATS
jgi:hypothetical protein